MYVHIPFCRAKCPYCHFASVSNSSSGIPRYLAALEKEIRLKSAGAPALETLFFGGGTPTVLEPEHWLWLMGMVQGNFSLAPEAEITVECNPESASPETLALLRELGVNRLSFGLQAVQDRLLKTLGRIHDFAAFQHVFRQARALGFSNINVDLMYGLPGQTLADWKETLNVVKDFSLEHVSAYALTVEDGTPFQRSGVKTDDDLQADMYETASDVLSSTGYEHYEISNFARPSRQCRHNLRYWRNQDCLGVGVSAAEYRRGVRRKNTESLLDYLSAMEDGRSPVIEEKILSETEKVGEDLMLSLRLKEGVVVDSSAQKLYGAVLERFASLGFLTFDANHCCRPTQRGWLLSNQLFQELLIPQS